MSSGSMSSGEAETAHAKVNLFLHVTGRRDDGYHLLDSLVVFAGVADRLTVGPDPELRLSLAGPFAPYLQADPGDDPEARAADNLVLRAADNLVLRAADNLVLRAAQGLIAAASRAGRVDLPGAHLTLEKQLPVASGIGGGSADAAAALRLLRRFWSLDGMDDERLHDLASGLGADVPVCLAQKPARMQGIGEILREAPALPELGMVLINCGEAVATPAVFRARAPGFTPQAALPDGWPDAASLAVDLARLSNDLEAAACLLCPAIETVLSALHALPGCLFARMSGSGATCFGLFETPQAATLAVRDSSLPAGWWVWAGALR